MTTLAPTPHSESRVPSPESRYPNLRRVPSHSTTPLSQQGVALLTALLIVALATMLAVAMATGRQIALQRGVNVLRGEQAWQYALGLEAWAEVFLHEDLASGSDLDAPNEAWAGQLPVIPVPGGRLTGDLRDLNGRFNVNTLLGDYAALAERRFKRLLAVLEMDPLLAVRVADWLDADTEARAGGAEDYAYTGLQPPYRAANAPLRHPSALRLILGLSQADWERLAPHVSALPEVNSIINVNTATVPVLMSLDAHITREMAEALARAARAGFPSADAFLRSPILRGVAIQDRGVGVRSYFFLAHGVVELDSSAHHFYSLIRRANGTLKVLRRSRGVL